MIMDRTDTITAIRLPVTYLLKIHTFLFLLIFNKIILKSIKKHLKI